MNRMKRMNRMLRVLCFVLSGSCLAIRPVSAQDVRIGDDIQWNASARTALAVMKRNTAAVIPVGKLTDQTTTLSSASNIPSCAATPAVADAVNFRDDAYLLDRDVAAQLKVNFFGSITGSVDTNTKVFVRELSKFANCKATDGTGNVMYGSSLRATVLIDTGDIAGGVNFAIAAASATVKAHSVQVRVESLGFGDAQVAIKGAIAQSITLELGFQITTSPQTIASMAFQAHTATGKLKALITPTTPSG